MALKVYTCEHCGGHPVKISWSALKTHEECRQKRSLQSQKKTSKMVDVRNFFPGRVTDITVRRWLQENPHDNIGRMPSMVEEVLQSALDGEESREGETVAWKSKGDRDEVKAACIEAVKTIEPALVQYVLPYEWQADFGFRTPVLLAHPSGTMDRVILNGFMDIIVRDPETDTWRIYDVKHTLNKDYWKGSFGQLVFYAYENQMRTGKMPTEVGFFQPLVKESVKRWAMTEQYINSLAARVQAMADEVWRGEDQPRYDSSACTFCEVKHACVKFKPTRAANGRHQMTLL